MVVKAPAMNINSGANLDEIREMLHRQMLDAVSHDLKTPLSTMIGSLEIYKRMEDKLTPEKKTILINTALSEAYRLDHFITNILDMAKLEGDNVKIKPEKTNLTNLINDSLTRLGPRRNNCDIQLMPKGNVFELHIDPMLLSRALLLLLDNAAKHSGKSPVIHVEYGVDEKEGFISVRDHGPGIPEDKRDEIFEKYTRLAKADHQNAGTGLGLALSRKLITLLDGSVVTTNHKDGGAIFRLSFPAATAA